MGVRRTITIEIETELEDEPYTDLAHAVWAVAHLAVGGRVTVRADAHADRDAMNRRWAELGATVPWV